MSFVYSFAVSLGDGAMSADSDGCLTVLVVAALAGGIYWWSGSGGDPVFSLYRTSLAPGEKAHIATFDAREGDSYNRENCDVVRALMASQPGVSVTFWCEKGGASRWRPWG